MSAFDWRNEKSVLAADFGAPTVKPAYPQLSYYHRKMAMGTHPRQIRRAGGDVLDQRFKANRLAVESTPQP